MKTYILSLLALSLVACTVQQEDPHPTEFQAARQYTRAACSRAIECAGLDPAVQDECVDDILKKMNPKPSTSAPFGCTQSEVNACEKAIRSATCEEIMDNRTSGEKFDACRCAQ